MNDLQEIVGEDVTIAPEAPEAPQEKQEEVTQQAPDAAPEHPAEPKVVPLAALHEERTRRKELATELANERQARQQMEARVEARLQAIQRANEPQPPSFEENPALALKHGLDTVNQTLAQQQERQQQDYAQRQQQEQVQRAAYTVRQHEAQFVAQKPDYQQAVEFMRDQRTREFQALGYDLEAAQRAAVDEMVQGALMNAAQGINPAERAYRVAEARGYKAQAQTVSESEKFDAQAKGTAAAKSLGGGGASKSQLTAQQLLAMSDDDFAAATNTDAKWRKAMGG